MEKEFVPYEIALELKELGFEIPYPIGGFQGGKVFYYEKGELYYDGRPMYSSDAHSGQLLAPLFQQAFRWFRDKRNLDNTIITNHAKIEAKMVKSYRVGIIIVKNNSIDSFFLRPSNDKTKFVEFETYEQAELECLKKLIEIAKK